MTQAKSRRRTAPEKWRIVFQEMTESTDYENGITLDDISAIAARHDIQVTRETIRVKLHRYAAKEILKKVGFGRYQIGPKGYDFFKIALPKNDRKLPAWGLKKKAWAANKLAQIRKLH